MPQQQFQKAPTGIIEPVNGRSLFTDFGMGSLFGGGGKVIESKLEGDEYGGEYKEDKLGKPDLGFDKFKGDLKQKFDSLGGKGFKEEKFKPKQKEGYGDGYDDSYDEGYKSKSGKVKG